MNVLATAAATGGGGNVILGLFLWAAIIISYWVPTIVALVRHVPNKGSVIVVNAFLGWTVVGWVVALAMACRSVPQPVEPVTRSTGG
jgi:Superinfection immunity protein